MAGTVTKESTSVGTEPVFTFPGDAVKLRIDTDVLLPPKVTVVFVANTFVWKRDPKTDQAVVPGGGVRGPRLEFRLDLDCKKVGAGTNHPHRFEIPWVVDIPGGAPRRAFEVSYRVLEAGGPEHAESLQELVVRTIKLTRKPTLLRIMLHEFAKEVGGKPAFDPGVPEQFIDELTPQQRKLLFTAGTAEKPRLVVFVTFTPKVALGPDKKVRRRRHPMAADACRHRDPFEGVDINDTKKVPDLAKAKDITAARRRADLMWSNSSFSVFRCAGPKKDVTLVCHTEHFLMNPYNTREVFKGSHNGAKSPDWLSKSNATPPRFMVQVGMPAFGESFNFYGAMWQQVLRGDGTNLMKGNFLHSMINTNGCWMLFRNYNFPVKFRETLSIEGIMALRWPPAWDGAGGTRGTVPKWADLLKSLGYDAKSGDDLDDQTVGSELKAPLFDRNFAAVWFAHDILGIRYWGGHSSLNDYRTHGLGTDAELKTFPLQRKFGGILECHAAAPAACDATKCAVYKKGRYRAHELLPPPPPPGVQVLELEDVNFHFDSCVLLPDSRADRTAPPGQNRITGLAAIKVILDVAELFPEKHLLVVGHTDTKGATAYNQKLSDERAENVHTYLLGDRAAWAACSQEHFMVEDWQQILAWIHATLGWDTHPGDIDNKDGPASQKALKELRRRFSAEVGPPIPQSGPITVADWGAFFDLYEQDLARQAGVEVSGLAARRANVRYVEPRPRVGCGEHFPIEAVGVDGFKSSTNRRVELLFFDPGEEPALACHAGPTCNPAACDLYRPGSYKPTYLPVDVEELRGAGTWDVPDDEWEGSPSHPPTAEWHPSGEVVAPPPANPEAQVPERTDAVDEPFDLPPAAGLHPAARLPGGFEHASTFPRPASRPTLKKVAERLAKEPSLRALLVGHCADSGDAARDHALSLERARAVADWLAGDAAALRARFDAGKNGPAHAWEWAEVQWLLHELTLRGSDRFYPGKVDGVPGRLTLEALAMFQVRHALPVTWRADEATLKKLVAEYLALLGPQRPTRDRLDVLGGGSWHPPLRMRAEGDDEAKLSAHLVDRVDVLLFQAGALTPPPAALPTTPGKGDAVYRAWCDATAGSELNVPGSTFSLPIQVIDGSKGGVPVEGFAVELFLLEDGAPTRIHTFKTSKRGCAELSSFLAEYELRWTAQGKPAALHVIIGPEGQGGVLIDVALAQS